MAGINHTPLVLKTGINDNDINTEIDKLQDFLAAVKIGEKFQPEVSMKGILEIKMARQRLRLALEKVRGNMKDYRAMGDVLTGMREGDHTSRIKLIEVIEKLQRQLTDIDGRLLEQFKFEEATRLAIPQCEENKQFLRREKSIIVVAGEVSSGKSTLLNLILGEDKILPTTRLSCTFTACELVYGTTKQAFILNKDGKSIQDIPFKDRGEFIYKQTSRDKPFEHSGVRLCLPLSMLQSGITFVDTPGVGEQSTTEEIVLDYVKRNEVFGFILTINASDSGGVRLKFKELLRKLSGIEDVHGQPKFNPSSVICVVNFWDKVPEDEKKETREQIAGYLKEMPFMGTFDPEEQIFFMDCQGAMESLNLEAKLITDDFQKLIDGIPKYFPCAQKLKLEKPYLWIQNIFERMIHPLKSFLVKQRPSFQTSEIKMQITEVEGEYENILKEAEKKFEKALSELSKKLIKSLPEYKQEILTWKPDDIPSQQPDESWVTFEERLDKAIDDKIAQVLVQVEETQKFISKTYKNLALEVSTLINPILNKLNDIERALRNSAIRGMRRRNSTSIEGYQYHRINVSIGQVHGAELIVPRFTAKNMYERLIYGPTLALFGSAQQQRRHVIEQEMAKFNSNPSQCMAIRAEVIYKCFCTRENINLISKKELKKIKEYITRNEEIIPEQIKSNKALLQNHTEIATQNKPNDSKYRAFLEEIQKLYDELLLLGRNSIVTDTFRPDAIEAQAGGARITIFPGINMPQRFSNAKLRKRDKVTLMEFNALPSCVLRYRETDRYHHQENLRMRVVGEKAPEFLGTYHSGQTLVLLGHLIPARCFTEDKKKWQGQKGTIMTFLGHLGRALNELHLRKMAHCILSLDTLLLEDFTVRLTNLFELATLQIDESEDLQTGQLLYLAPEILFGGQKLYTMAADVYAMGLVMIELWYCYDVFNDLKILQFNLLKEQIKCNPGKFFLDKAERVMKEAKKKNEKIILLEMPKKYKTLVCDCLKDDNTRIDMGVWTETWDAYKGEIIEEAKHSERCGN